MIATALTRTALRVSEISSEADFERLKEPWNSLARRVTRSVFLRHEWFSAAWAWRQADAALWILCVFSDDELVGVLPLLRPHRSTNGGRFLEFLTVPDTQHCDVLVEPERAAEICQALVDHMVAMSSRWDALRLGYLPPRSKIETAFVPLLAAHGLPCRIEAVDCNLFVDLESGWKDYYASRSRSVKKACNLAANRLARVGDLHVESLTSTDVDREHLRRFLDDVVSISARSWKQGTGNSLDMPGPRAFIQKLTEYAFAKQWLSIWLLRIHGKPVAMEYQLVFDGKVYALRSDFDDEYKNVSPGSYLNRRLIEELFGNGFKRYYMGPGKNSYKKRWSETGETVSMLIGYAPTIRGRAVGLWPDLKPKLRTLKDRLIGL